MFNWFYFLGDRVQEDLAIMVEGEWMRCVISVTIQDFFGAGTDGRYYFQDGAVCIAGKFLLPIVH